MLYWLQHDFYSIYTSFADYTLKSVHSIMELSSECIMQSVLKKVGSIEGNVQHLLSDCFTLPDPFSYLRTEHQQTKFYREHFGLIVSYQRGIDRS